MRLSTGSRLGNPSVEAAADLLGGATAENAEAPVAKDAKSTAAKDSFMLARM